MQKTKNNPKSRKNALTTQKRAAIIIAGLVVLLAVAFVIAGVIAETYTYPDHDGQSYTIKKHRGEYALFKDGELCDVGSDGGVTYYLTEIGTQVRVDPETGAYTVYAVVDVEDTEQVAYSGSSVRVMMFKQLTYDKSSTRDQSRIIKSIEVCNQYSSYTLRRASDNYFYIEGHETATLIEDTFAQLSSGCGYTLSLQRLENPKRLADGSIDYAEYGLVSEQRATVDEDGNTVTYDYVPTRYTVTTMNDDTYPVTLGDATVSGGGYYARYADRDTVYVLASANLEAGVLRPVEELVTPMLIYPMSSTAYYNVTDFTYRSDFDHDAITRDLYIALLGDGVADILSKSEDDLTDEELERLERLEVEYATAVNAMSDEAFSALYEEIVNRHSRLVTKFSYVEMADRDNTILASSPYKMSSEYMAGYLPHANNISDMLGSLCNMSFERVVTLSPTDEDMAAYGLTEFAHEIAFIYNEKVSGMTEAAKLFSYFKVSEKTEDGYYYAYSPTYDMIVCFSESEAEYLEWEEIDWYEREYFQIYLAFVKSITVEGAGLSTPLVFTPDNSKSDQSEGINTDNLEIYVNGKRMDYTFFCTKLTGEMTTEDADYNFHRLFQSFLTASIEGNAALTDEQAATIRNTPDEECLLKFTVIAEDTAGNSIYNVYRFYRYTERKAYMTVETLPSPTSPRDPARAEGRFYVLKSFCDKLLADVDRFMNGEEVVVASKN